MSDFDVAASTDAFEQAIRGEEMVIAKFQTRTCFRCRQLEPGLKQIVQRMQGVVRVMDVDAEDHPSLAERFDVRGVPTLILFKDGKELTRRDGFQSISMLREWVAPFVGN